MFDNPFNQKIVHDIQSLIKDDIHAAKKQVIMEFKDRGASVHLERDQVVVRESFDEVVEGGFQDFLAKWSPIVESHNDGNENYQIKTSSQRQCTQMSLTEQRRNQNRLGFYEIVFDVEHK